MSMLIYLSDEKFNVMTRKVIPKSARKFFLLILFYSLCIPARSESIRNEMNPLPAPIHLQEIQDSAYPAFLAQANSATLQIDVTNILDKTLSSKVVLKNLESGSSSEIMLPEGQAAVEQAVGNYTAYTYVYEAEVPLLVDIQGISVRAGQTTKLSVSLLEGSSGNRAIRAFDRDYDLALDRVELEAGTSPEDAGSIPGVARFDWPSPVLDKRGGWYRGELHAHSVHGRGVETVAELVKRAEKLKLDFLAITDRNTLAAALDPDFQSKSTVLIPAMEWGDDERGQALLYAPATFPKYTESLAEAQAMVITLQAQGGLFAIAHPNFPIGSWQWGLQYAGAVEVWCREWRMIPPMYLGQLDERLTQRKDGRLVYSIAIAAATQGFSANSQAALFYDLELVRGMKASVIAGSNTAHPKVPMGEPLTYVYAREKSMRGIVQGLRNGRTFVSRGVDGPIIEFWADVLADNTVDVGMGGIIPVNRKSRLIVSVLRAKGARLDILLNGLPIRSRLIKSDRLTYAIEETPDIFAVYRVRIVKTADEMGFGPTELLAMSSPIYAQSYVVESVDSTDGWVELENNYEDPRSWEGFLPPDDENYEVDTIKLN